MRSSSRGSPHPRRRRLRPLRCVALLSAAATLACAEGEVWNDGVLLRPNGDVLVGQEEVSVSEDVRGDAMAAGRTIVFDGSVGGSYLGAGAEQRIVGRIDGSVRAAGAQIRLDATVGRNVTAVGGEVEIGPETVIEGNAYMAGGRVRLLGRVDGDVYVGAGELDLEGEVGGDVRAEVSSLTVGPDARIGGELRYRIEEDGIATISPQATLTEGAVELERRPEDDGGIGFPVFRVLSFLLVGLVLVALFPVTLSEATEDVDTHAPAALGLGLLWLILVPPAVVVMAATVIGIPLALTVAVLYGLSLYLAPVVTGVWLGREIVRARDPADRRDAAVVFLAGGAIVAIAIVLPWVGWLARLAATCFGLGAVMLLIRDRGAIPGGGRTR